MLNYIYSKPRVCKNTNIIKTFDRDVKLTMYMSEPVTAIFDNFLSMEECDKLIELSKNRLNKSTTVNMDTGTPETITNRSSEGAFFNKTESDFIINIEKRTSEIMNWPVENGEGLQVLYYKTGGEYKPHFDYFPPEIPGSKIHLANSGQRVSTLVMYLNDVKDGGGTTFPKLNLTIIPKKGSAAYFEYFNDLGQVNPLSLHSGDPVIIGEKWIAVKWMRENRF